MRNLLLATLFLLPGSPASAAQPERDDPTFDAHTVAFVQLMFGHQPDEEHQPGQDDPLLPERKVQEPLEIPGAVAVLHKFETPFVASELCGVIVFVSGLAGWIALGVAVLILERKQTKV